MRNVLAVLVLLFAPSLFASSATFIGTSTTNTFGKDGSVLPMSGTPPTYASVNVAGAATWNWPPWCWYSSTSFTLAINLTGSHEVTLWLLDEDKGSRSETITISDAGSGAVLDTESASSFTAPGKYLSWTVSGNIVATVKYTGGLNAVVSGVYFDTPGSTVTPPTCPAPIHTANLAWQPSTSAGVTGYNVYQAGVKITPTPIANPNLTVTNLAAGATIVFNVTAVSATGESPLSSPLTVIVPTP